MELKKILNELPERLDDKDIIKANEVSSDNKGNRVYNYKDFQFNVPENVFLPGGTSQIIHDQIYEEIDVTNKKIIIMGAGCGVECVICANKGASMVYASDIDSNSVDCSKDNLKKNLKNSNNCNIKIIISDLFSNYEVGLEADYIFFNPPTVDVRFSNDPNVVRNVCTGKDILFRFFDQVKEKQLLSKSGIIMIVIVFLLPDQKI
jgi:release factor glutamine methyltransferase